MLLMRLPCFECVSLTAMAFLFLQIGAIQGASQFLCQISKGVSGVVGDLLGSQVGFCVRARNKLVSQDMSNQVIV